MIFDLVKTSRYPSFVKSNKIKIGKIQSDFIFGGVEYFIFSFKFIHRKLARFIDVQCRLL